MSPAFRVTTSGPHAMDSSSTVRKPEVNASSASPTHHLQGQHTNGQRYDTPHPGSLAESVRAPYDTEEASFVHSGDAPAVIIPPPHVPLRKKASLKLRTFGPQGPIDDPKQATMITMAQQLRPETSRWSKDGAVILAGEDDGPSLKPRPGPHRLAPLQRPTTAYNNAEEDTMDTLSPLLRPATAVSDYPSSRPTFRGSSTLTEPLPERGPPFRPARGPSSQTSTTGWRDGAPQIHRESTFSTTLTNNSSAINTSASSVWTARSSRSTRDSSGLEWNKVSDDDLSVDDCIDMYVQGFRDDPEVPAERLPDPLPAEPIHLAPSPIVPDKSESPRTATRRNGSILAHESRASDASRSVTSTSSRRNDSIIGTPKSRSSDTPTVLSDATDSITTSNLSSRRRGPQLARDGYGFKHESQHVTANRYAAWHKDYKDHLARRKRKWTHLMNTNGLHSSACPERFPPRSSEVKRYIRKGIPPEWRGAAWFYYGDGASFLTANPGLYDKLVDRAQHGGLRDSDRDHIERDLNRTFPDNIHFKPDALSSVLSSADTLSPALEPAMIKSLRRMLEAYAVQHPKVGYCQSLNFLAGHLLLFMRLSFPNQNFEERAFALLCILTEKYLPGTHGLVLEGANVDIGVLMTILQETMPSLWAKLDDDGNPTNGSNPNRKPNTRTSVTLKTNTDRLPTVSLATTAWFMSCFVSTLPIETTCRVWDCLWYEGSKTIFRVALAIFKLGEKQIKKANDPMEVFQIVQNLPKALLDANELMEVATMKTSRGLGQRLGTGTPGFGGLSQKTVESRREERRAYAKGARDRAQSGTAHAGGLGESSTTVPLPPMPAESPSGGGGLKRRVTLKRLKSFKKLA